MNTAQALHSAARRYCIDNHRHWTQLYANIPNQGRASDGYHYSPKALDTFPRYNMLSAIREAVETIDSESLHDFVMAKALVVNAGWMANDDFTRDPLRSRAKIIWSIISVFSERWYSSNFHERRRASIVVAPFPRQYLDAGFVCVCINCGLNSQPSFCRCAGNQLDNGL